MLGLEADEGKLKELVGPLEAEPDAAEVNRPEEVRGRLSNPSGNPFPPPPDCVLQSSMTESLRDVGLGGSST
jgi:hypothetical protein